MRLNSPPADPAEVKLLKKECFNRWYGLWPYYVAFTLSRLPFQIVFNVIFLSMTYWMSGLPVDAHRFALYLLVGLVVSFVAEGLGLAIGASFSITVNYTYKFKERTSVECQLVNAQQNGASSLK